MGASTGSVAGGRRVQILSLDLFGSRFSRFSRTNRRRPRARAFHAKLLRAVNTDVHLHLRFAGDWPVTVRRVVASSFFFVAIFFYRSSIAAGGDELV